VKNNKTEILICDTLLVMMESKPYYSIKVTDLIKKANISRSTFYVYFDSISDVLQKIHDDFLGAFPDETDVSSLARSKFKRNEIRVDEREMEGYLYLKSNMKTYRILSGPNGDPSFYIRLRNRVTRITSSVLSEELKSIPTTNKQIIATFFAGGKIAVNDWWACHESNISMDEIACITSNLYAKMLNFILKEWK